MDDTQAATTPTPASPPPDYGNLAGIARKLDDTTRRRQATTAPIIQGMKDTQTKVKTLEAQEEARPEVKDAPPPEVPAPDPVRGFASAAGIFAMLASALTHTPMTAAMSSMASAINARNANDMTAYEKHYQQWKEQTDQALKIDAAHRAKVQEALTLMQTDMAGGEAMLHAADTEYQDEKGSTLAMAQLWTQRAQLDTARAAASMQMKRTQQEIDENAPLAFAGASLAAAMKSGDPQKIAEAQDQMRVARASTGSVGVQAFVGPDQKTYLMKKDAQGNISWTNTAGEPVAPPDSVSRTASKISAPTIAQTKGPDGAPIYTLAQQMANGQWVTADEKRTPIEGVEATMKADDIPNPNDPTVKQTAKAIAEYRQPLLAGWVLKTPWGHAVTAEVNKENPDYAAERYSEISAAMKAFGTGPQSNQIRYINVAVNHLGTLKDLADALKNGDYRMLNEVYQRISEETGQPAPTSFDSAKQLIGQEITKAVIAGGGGVTERQAAGDQLNRARSPDQIVGPNGVIDTYRRLLGGQMGGLKSQFHQSIGMWVPPTVANFDAMVQPETAKFLHMADNFQNAPPIGTIEEGHRYKGGDPANPASWEPVNAR